MFVLWHILKILIFHAFLNSQITSKHSLQKYGWLFRNSVGFMSFFIFWHVNEFLYFSAYSFWTFGQVCDIWSNFRDIYLKNSKKVKIKSGLVCSKQRYRQLFVGPNHIFLNSGYSFYFVFVTNRRLSQKNIRFCNYVKSDFQYGIISLTSSSNI